MSVRYAQCVFERNETREKMYRNLILSPQMNIQQTHTPTVKLKIYFYNCNLLIKPSECKLYHPSRLNNT